MWIIEKRNGYNASICVSLLQSHFLVREVVNFFMIVEKKSPDFRELAAVQIRPGHFVQLVFFKQTTLTHCHIYHDKSVPENMTEVKGGRSLNVVTARGNHYTSQSQNKSSWAFSTTVHILKTSILSSRLLKTAIGQQSLCVLLGRYTAPVSCNLLNNEPQSARVPEQIASMHLRCWGIAHSFGDCMCGKPDLN